MGFEFFCIEHVNNKVGESDREEEVFCQYFETICTSSLRSGHFKLIRGFLKFNFADFPDLAKIVHLIYLKVTSIYLIIYSLKQILCLSHLHLNNLKLNISPIIRFVYSVCLRNASVISETFSLHGELCICVFKNNEKLTI